MGGESPKPASTPTGAVFLSYASEDAEAARRICDSLRAAGIDVWFDQSELRGGDAWDRKIRKQIHDCALFIPIISAHSQARLEGYFRREWKLAADRTHDMAEEKAFLVPVTIDDTSERQASVPDKFCDVQWTRLPGGETPPAFVGRVRRLLLPDTPMARGGATAVPAGSTTEQAQSGSVLETWRFRPALWAIGVLLTLALSYFVLDKLWLSKRIAATANGAARSATAPEKSIAVLPFVDLSEKHDQEYFADGMAEEILDILAKIPELKVIARASSFQFRGKAEDVRKIGEQLGASYILEGSIRRSGDQIRVTAQLIDSRDGAHRWSDSYDAKMDDVLRVQEAIAAGMSRALELTLSGGAAPDRALASPENYDLYMRGLHALDGNSKDGCEQAIEIFGQLLRLEPNSERALISLARAHECIAWGGWTVPGAGLEQAREFATRTLKVNPESAQAHLVLATVYIEHDFDWSAAQREIEAASAFTAPDARAFTVAARLSQALGRFDQAINLLNQALARDPLDPLVYDILGDTYMRSGLYEKAERAYRRCLQIAPNYLEEHFYVSNALLMQGRLKEALAEVDVESDIAAKQAGRALVFHAMGRSADSDEALKALIGTSANDWGSGIARVYAFRGDRNEALAWLDRAYERRDTDLYFIKGDPLLKNLEGDPRYRAFLRKMNLPEQ